MYAATHRDRRLHFVVSGKLWNRSLVMQDLETGSLWSHILGRAMEGPLEGAELEVIPSVITTWADWKKEHPQSTVLALDRTAREFDAAFQKTPGRFVLGLVWRGRAVAYPFDALAREHLVHDEIKGTPVLVVFDRDTTSARMYQRRLDDRVLSFEATPEGRLRDRKTASTWDPATGRCLAGQLKGEVLPMLPAIVSFRHAWETFHPESRLYE